MTDIFITFSDLGGDFASFYPNDGDILSDFNNNLYTVYGSTSNFGWVELIRLPTNAGLGVLTLNRHVVFVEYGPPQLPMQEILYV